MARQAVLQGPEFVARLEKTYYRGNDDRRPDLYNGGVYRTCNIHVSLRTEDGTTVRPGMNVAGKRLFVHVEIEPAPNTLESHFRDEEMTRIFMLSREVIPSAPAAGDDHAYLFVVDDPGQRWVAACPVGHRRPGRGGPSAARRNDRAGARCRRRSMAGGTGPTPITAFNTTCASRRGS